MKKKHYIMENMTVSNCPKVTVIIYCSNRNNISLCVESIIEQTYKNIDIILINDTEENIDSTLLNEQLESERCVIYNNSQKNICSAIKDVLKDIDSDYISVIRDDCRMSVDYYRLLTRKSMEEECDIVLCDVAKYRDDGTRIYYNLDALRLKDIKGNAFKEFVQSEGNIIGFTLFYNMLFKAEFIKKVFLKANPFGEYDSDLLLFLLNLYSLSKKTRNIHNAYLFVKDEFRAINGILDKNKEKESINKCDQLLQEKCVDRLKINNLYMSYYGTNFAFNNCFYKEYIEELISEITSVDYEKNTISTRYEKIIKLFSITTTIDNLYDLEENIKEFICNDKVKYFGFDMFDTLVVRPFYEPTDIFYLLNTYFNNLISRSSCIDFSIMRKNGEMACRGYYHVQRPCNEDVTLQEIYDFISEEYGIDRTVTNKMCEFEKELEYKYIRQRKIGKELFDLVLFEEKIPFVASDMYLPLKHITAMLDKCGYQKISKIYLSNEIGLSKYSGSLFEYIKKDLCINKDALIGFIGDNFEVDVKRSAEKGFISFHLARPMELFMNANQQIYTGEYFKKMYTADGGIIDLNTALKFLGVRTMLGVVANHEFDNPFISINRSSDFNVNPRFIGYFVCGMFLLSESKWIFDQAEKDGVDTIHFVSRDGFFCKQCFEMLKNACGCKASSNYLYLSRKAIVPMYLEKAINITELYLVPHALKQSPKSILKILQPIIENEIFDRAEEICHQAGFPYERRFSSMHQYYCFTKFFAEKFYSEKKYTEYIAQIKPYFEGQVKKNDVLFDVGYSGRGEKILSSILGYPVSSYYFHTHEPMSLARKKRLGFDIATFYSFKPVSAFVTREQIFTPNTPSCIGFGVSDGKCYPKFEDNRESYIGTMLVSKVQEAALEFVQEFIELFSNETEVMTINYFDACYPFEYYMHYSKDFDRNIFAFVDFEDDFGMNQTLNIKDYWDRETHNNLCDIKINSNDNRKVNVVNTPEVVSLSAQKEQEIIMAVMDNMKKSWTWRVGRIFVAVPSFIKRKIFKKEE